jgi:hypothetical protein
MNSSDDYDTVEDPIRCTIRIRPLNKNELKRGDYSCLSVHRDCQTLHVCVSIMDTLSIYIYQLLVLHIVYKCDNTIK